ncbi:MAG: 16S rRNA (cytosine(1402)-N(4))-methyltransferase [Chloroflexi bacterium 13_1_40CM_4_65_16]|nr:MAG: 16S rRNA (cytosine(1402)-N(4))-methyltransferase [Chloroflexi bacterium 13_1_40CM_66_19]OLC49898.1 MAG: 16S rRNA (cytosine(1402)-N(4))-methyltransferase [Chloroflexi bacterium 13_1_40CM_4_65_16]OLD54131.1 MAG: 16S rRNA (cytosine(1402)-N(4))-methyltransferase [Actinobacteria bacterium 13_1_40CM_2_66_13]TMF87758.1 MAG: 16S rRNA (cytosine(1402)-N(4))-methyltransferase RsmH [Chloroflexota bacterium]TMG09634.1 MAG: 16S rRNA (cytosine(1402)-N(4))-methyltransferase RsmH [Chloroflexota bacteriu
MSPHVPALSQEVIELLQPREGAVAIDCTLGQAGHARQILERITPGGRLLGIDRDPAAVQAARQTLGSFGQSATVVHGRFSELGSIAADNGFRQADSILFDFGISSNQVDDPERGFSFRAEGPLDMRMDPNSTLTASQIVNEYDVAELERILREYGEERWARRIAQFVVARRPLRTTRDLAQAVEAAIPRRAWPRDINVATRTFQGIRIAVNDELGEIESGLRAALSTLKPGGRMATISFHSLEDRLVKSFFNVESKDCICPPQQPVCTCGHRATLRVITRHPVRPSEAEVAANPRARSARLRVAEKLPTPDPSP